MRRTDLEYVISQTLGVHVEDYSIEGIADEIHGKYPQINSIDDIPSLMYWSIVDRHEKGNR